MKCEIPNLSNLYYLTNLVLVHKFSECSIRRLKLTCKYQYFNYIMLKHSSFFNWTKIIHYPVPSMSSMPLVISDYPSIRTDLKNIYIYIYIFVYVYLVQFKSSLLHYDRSLARSLFLVKRKFCPNRNESRELYSSPGRQRLPQMCG